MAQTVDLDVVILNRDEAEAVYHLITGRPFNFNELANARAKLQSLYFKNHKIEELGPNPED
jgi:hypothetical protein